MPVHTDEKFRQHPDCKVGWATRPGRRWLQARIPSDKRRNKHLSHRIQNPTPEELRTTGVWKEIGMDYREGA
jgi:hypothetical protein